MERQAALRMNGNAPRAPAKLLGKNDRRTEQRITEPTAKAIERTRSSSNWNNTPGDCDAIHVRAIYPESKLGIPSILPNAIQLPDYKDASADAENIVIPAGRCRYPASRQMANRRLPSLALDSLRALPGPASLPE